MATVTGLNGGDRRCSTGWKVGISPAFLTIELTRTGDMTKVIIALTGEEWQAIRKATECNLGVGDSASVSGKSNQG